MNNKRDVFIKHSVKAERVVIALCVVGTIIASLLLFNEDLYNRFIGGAFLEDTSKPLVGIVTEKINDTRFKSSNTLAWVNARKKQNVRIGDGIFTGAKSRSHVALKDGNGVTIDENSLVVFRESKEVDLGIGNFRLKIGGTVKLSVLGQQTTIESDGSEIQFIVPKEKGAKPLVRLLSGNASVQVQGRPRQTLTPQKIEILPLIETAPRKSASVPEQETAAARPESTPAPNPEPVRRLQLYDIFETKEDKSLWRRSEISEKVNALLPLENQISLSSSYSEPTALSAQGIPVTLTASGAAVDGYVYEVSADETFPAELTRAKWNREGRLAMQLVKPGTFYYRVRGVNQKTELTQTSNLVKIVILPEEKIVPLASTPTRRELAPLVIRRPTTTQAQRPQVMSPKIEKPQPAKPTKQVAKSNDSIPIAIHLPTAVASSTTQIKTEERTNQSYSSSRVDFETGTFTVFSPDEKDLGRTNPYAYTLGIRSKHWFNDRSGFEGMARVKAGGLNESANGINPLALEARYHHRLYSSLFGRTNFSLLTGLEVYRNIGRGYFAQQYDLGKIGFAVDFPVGNRWDMGGDVAVGFGTDQTTKYEAVGRLNYYFRRRYSLGAGYRLFLLQAGSEKTAPLDFPYKETWGEGFFVFRWHY